MNREQAKIIGQMSDEQIRVVSDLTNGNYVRDRDLIVAYADGAEIETQDPYSGEWGHDCRPTFGTGINRRIATPKITFNGVEIDAPIKDAYSIADGGTVWALGFCSATCKLEPKPIGRNQAVYVLKGTMAGICWETHEACQLYCDTHNKMMGGG